MLMQKQIYYTSNDNTLPFEGLLAYDASSKQKRPGIIVVHDWTGRNEFAAQKAALMAEWGYIGFAVDLYGHAKCGENNEEKSAFMKPLIENRRLLRERLNAAVTVLKNHPQTDPQKIAAIGFCFGGLAALELARSGENHIKGVISFHGLLTADKNLACHTITSKILALHGFDDPMVPVEQIMAFTQEMNTAQADWQMHMYGHTKHAFTNPQASDKKLGTVYNALADKRAWIAARNFLTEIFE